LPSASYKYIVTRYVPGKLYACCAVTAVEVVPSPKFHRILLLDNVTLFCTLGENVKGQMLNAYPVVEEAFVKFNVSKYT
jgi:hypothetical protein